MSDTTGRIGWIDMTVDNAAELRSFYEAVAGRSHADVDACAAALYQA